MLSIDDEASLEAVLTGALDSDVKELLRRRREQLGHTQPLADVARFLIVQTNDTAEEVANALGFSVLVNQVDGSSFGEEDFSPSSEWIADHGSFFEVVFILEDSGFAHVVIVQQVEGVQPELLKLCADYTTEQA